MTYREFINQLEKLSKHYHADDFIVTIDRKVLDEDDFCIDLKNKEFQLGIDIITK